MPAPPAEPPGVDEEVLPFLALEGVAALVAPPLLLEDGGPLPCMDGKLKVESALMQQCCRVVVAQ